MCHLCSHFTGSVASPTCKGPNVASQAVCVHFPRFSLAVYMWGCQLPEDRPILNILLVYQKFRRGWLSCVCRCKAAPPARAGLTAWLRVSSPTVVGVRVVSVFHVGALNTEKHLPRGTRVQLCSSGPGGRRPARKGT